MNLVDVTRLSNGPVLDLINWLKQQHLIANPLQCVPCNRAMEMVERNQNHVDGYLWRCTACRGKKSLREGSFFAEFPRITLGKMLLLMYLWSQRVLRSRASDMVRSTKNTVGRVFGMLRHCCMRDLQDRPIIPFGGRVFVLKCDESQFKHKSKFQRGRRARDDVWVFGVLSTEFTPCRGYFEVVRRRDRATLTQILQRVIPPGSEVHTDDWGAYRNLHMHVANVTVHRTVVHQNNFVDPLTGVHTQEAESAWARLKYYIKMEKGIRQGDVQDFLDEQMWRDWRGLDAMFLNLLGLVSTYYPV